MPTDIADKTSYSIFEHDMQTGSFCLQELVQGCQGWSSGVDSAGDSALKDRRQLLQVECCSGDEFCNALLEQT